jgi:hypothetical protein
MLEVPESKRFAYGESHFQIEPFHHAAAVFFPGLEIVHEQVLVPTQGFDEFLERLDATTHRPVAPVVQVLPGVPRAVVFPKHVEGFLDAISSDGFQMADSSG